MLIRPYAGYNDARRDMYSPTDQLFTVRFPEANQELQRINFRGAYLKAQIRYSQALPEVLTIWQCRVTVPILNRQLQPFYEGCQCDHLPGSGNVGAESLLTEVPDDTFPEALGHVVAHLSPKLGNAWLAFRGFHQRADLIESSAHYDDPDNDDYGCLFILSLDPIKDADVVEIGMRIAEITDAILATLWGDIIGSVCDEWWHLALEHFEVNAVKLHALRGQESAVLRRLFPVLNR